MFGLRLCVTRLKENTDTNVKFLIGLTSFEQTVWLYILSRRAEKMQNKGRIAIHPPCKDAAPRIPLPQVLPCDLWLQGTYEFNLAVGVKCSLATLNQAKMARKMSSARQGFLRTSLWLQCKEKSLPDTYPASCNMRALQPFKHLQEHLFLNTSIYKLF